MSTCSNKVNTACQNRLEDIRVMLAPKRFDFRLIDDGTLDTVIGIDDHEFRFSDTSAYRDNDGSLDLESFLDDEFDNMAESLNDYFSEYGLCFDYVEPETFEDQLEGYYRFQISYGGPSEEMRFYHSAGGSRPYKIEFWYLDWFDGAHKLITDHPTAIAVWNYCTCNGECIPGGDL